MRVLLVMLGACEFPDRIELSSPAFKTSHNALRDWLLDDAHGPMVVRDDCLDLFDSPRSWPDQEAELTKWLGNRTATEPAPTDLIVHYVGHGGFRDESRDYYLAIHATRTRNPYFSSIIVESLWRTLRSDAKELRRFLIIDACFAAATARHFMAPLVEAVKVKVRDLQEEENAEAEREALAMPDRGTAVLCSSSARDPASLAGVGGITQFTDGLMQVLNTGSKTVTSRLTLAQVHRLVKVSLRVRYKENAIPPELHAPDQGPGGLSTDVPLFPNVAQRVAQKNFILGEPKADDYLANLQTLATEAESALTDSTASQEHLQLWNARLTKAVKARPLDWPLTRVKSIYDASFRFRLRDAIKTIERFLSNKSISGDIDDEYADALFILTCYRLRLLKKGSDITPEAFREVIEALREAIEIRPDVRGWIDSNSDFRRLKADPEFLVHLDAPSQAILDAAHKIKDFLALKNWTVISFEGIRKGCKQNWDDGFLSGLIRKLPYMFDSATLKPGQRPGLKLRLAAKRKS